MSDTHTKSLDALTKSLDDVIKERKKVEGKTQKKGTRRLSTKRGGGADSKKGGRRPARGRNDSNNKDRDKPRKVGRKPISKPGVALKYIRRTRAGGARTGGDRQNEIQKEPTSRKRLRVSNLDFNITHKDLMDLFSKFGSLVKNKIDYDDLGRSLGTATVEYEKYESATKAIEEYHGYKFAYLNIDMKLGATLDGRKLTVEFDSASTKKKAPKVGRKIISKTRAPARREGGRRDDRRGDRRNGGRNEGSGFRRPRGNREGGNRRGGNRRGNNRRNNNDKRQ